MAQFLIVLRQQVEMARELQATGKEIKMSTHDPPEESELIIKSRKAAYCTRRLVNGAGLSPQDMEDMIQAAALAYWKRHQEGRPIPFCFVCARQAAEKHFYRKILGRNPRSPFSIVRF